MEYSKKTIQILPDGKKITASQDMTLFEALMHKGIFLRSDCGGKGRCGKCLVLRKNGNGALEKITACTHKVEEDISIKIPETSLLSSHVMNKAPMSFPDSFIKRMAGKTGKNGPYGAAVDLGTTTIAVYLCNMATGDVMASIAVKNPQSVYGDDVISRINAISRNGENLALLQKLVVNSIEWGLKNLLGSVQEDSVPIGRMVVVGNPTMIHILAGVDPKSIGTAPYAPAFYETRKFQSYQLGFATGKFIIQTLPQVSGFIGGDTLAAALAVDFQSQPDGTLLIDLGTNGELLLKNNGRLYATSCATGPAFEGAELSCGMQATPGAINSVEINEAREVVRLSVIGGNGSRDPEPSGLCGPGVISALAQLYNRGIVKASGAFESRAMEFSLAKGDAAKSQPPVFISQKDIRSVQLGKGALITGIEFLLKVAGLEYPAQILVAGAFGNHLNKDDIIALGMIPAISPDKVIMMGNSAGAGSVMALCDDYYVQQAIQIAEKITTIDLARNTQFQKRFVENLGFPKKE